MDPEFGARQQLVNNYIRRERQGKRGRIPQSLIAEAKAWATNARVNNFLKGGKAAAPIGKVKRTPAPPRAKQYSRRPANKNVNKHRYLLTALLGKNLISLTPNERNARLRNLLNNARKIRLSAPHQLASWSGSFLETSGFEEGARRKGTEIVDRGTKDTNPLLLIQNENGQPRVQPTLFIKSAFSTDWLKGSNWARARAVYPANVVNNMQKLITFTETLKIENAEGESVNVKGKTKGTTEIQPDIIISVPNQTRPGGEIHVYELKIGRGKKETIPAEAIQLAKMKFILDSYLKNLGWTTHIHFLPWMYAQNPNNRPNFINWKVSKIKLVKNIANKFISRLNQGYNIKVVNRHNNVLTKHLNIGTINALMNASRAGRLKNVGRAAGTISAQSQATIIETLSQGGRNIAPVVNYLQSVKNVVNTANSKAKGFRSIAGIWRDLLAALNNAKAAYIAHTPRNNLPSTFKINKPSNTMANISGISNMNTSENSSRKLSELNRIIKIVDIFLKSLNALRSRNPSIMPPSNTSLKTFTNIKNAVENIEVNSGKARARLSNANLNAVINAPDFGRTYAAFLAQHGSNAGRAINDRIRQLKINNPNFLNFYNTVSARKMLVNQK